MPLVRRVLLVAFAIANAGAAYAAGPPEYNGVFEARDPGSGAYTPLEREQLAMQTHIIGLGFGGAKVTENVQGGQSPVRFHAGAPITFIVKETSRDEDPNSLIHFVSLTSQNGTRFFETYAAGGFGGAKSTEAKSAVGFTADKYGDVYFKVEPNQPLPPGEYALLIAGSPATMQNGMPPAFCFGIDP